MKIFLITDAEHNSNTFPISLTSKGQEQAERVAALIQVYFEKEFPEYFDQSLSKTEKAKKAFQRMTKDERLPFGDSSKLEGLFGGLLGQMEQLGMPLDANDIKPKVKLWTSYHKRSVQMALKIHQELKELIPDVQREMLLTDVELDTKVNYSFWQLINEGFRVRQFLECLKYEESNENITNHIVVCHPVVARMFVTLYLNKDENFFNDLDVCNFASIRLLENGQDKGLLFDGYKI